MDYWICKLRLGLTLDLTMETFPSLTTAPNSGSSVAGQDTPYSTPAIIYLLRWVSEINLGYSKVLEQNPKAGLSVYSLLILNPSLALRCSLPIPSHPAHSS